MTDEIKKRVEEAAKKLYPGEEHKAHCLRFAFFDGAISLYKLLLESAPEFDYEALCEFLRAKWNYGPGWHPSNNDIEIARWQHSILAPQIATLKLEIQVLRAECNNWRRNSRPG